MSRGSRVVGFRVSAELMEEIEKERELQAEYSPYGPEDLSTFIVRAITERIAKRRRSRAKRRPKVEARPEAWPLLTINAPDLSE